QYDTINYEWRHNDIDGSRARFQGVMLDGAAAAIPEPSGVALLGLAGFGFLFRRRR
ncbi:PEP-CTERM sorting domain-containing protein, partial [bacterium]|nr:PEP-CTERM sorting domain-containing protein [bacterium]